MSSIPPTEAANKFINSSVKSSSYSVLDNKETFHSFYVVGKSKNDFLKVHYRHKNLTLAGLLEKSIYKENSTICRTIASLRFCSTTAAITTDPTTQEPKIFGLSQRCKSSHCHICNRIKSAKMCDRMMNALEKHKDVFLGKQFYFLTLTVRHTSEIRAGNYLPDFRKYLYKFFHSKLIKDMFSNESKVKGGFITSIECTIGNNGYHIHSHSLLCGMKLGIPVKDFEAQIKALWYKITKDSFSVKFDLIRPKPMNYGAKVNESFDTCNSLQNINYKDNKDTEYNLHNNTSQPNKENIECVKTITFAHIEPAILELMKYTTKSGALAKLNENEIDMYACWIIDTKGKNFFNASGIFRKLQIASNKSELDEPQPEQEHQESKQVILCKTSAIWFNRSPITEYSAKVRQTILEDARLNKIKQPYYDVTKYQQDIKTILSKMSGLETIFDFKKSDGQLVFNHALLSVLPYQTTKEAIPQIKVIIPQNLLFDPIQLEAIERNRYNLSLNKHRPKNEEVQF